VVQRLDLRGAATVCRLAFAAMPKSFHALRIHREGWDPANGVIPGNAVMSAGVAASQGSSLIRPLSRSTTCDKVFG
jgi:hypothetical protein